MVSHVRQVVRIVLRHRFSYQRLAANFHCYIYPLLCANSILHCASVTLNATWKAREHDVLFSPVQLTLILQVSHVAYSEQEHVLYKHFFRELNSCSRWIKVLRYWIRNLKDQSSS